MMMIMGRRCEDCGNQAKKECVYMRCRTCCKSKAFHCQTHIKSTWVPAYRRSHHQQHQHQRQPQPLFTTSSNIKRLRELQRLPDSSPSSSSGVQIRTTPEHLLAELKVPADFRCVKVSSIHDGKEQYAYQTTVNIGGHIFRGILHDQGPDKVMVDHHNNRNCNNRQETLLPPSTSSYPLMITSHFTDFMSGSNQYSSVLRR
ncbi:PREDICTED: protein SHI RELATED SEQUENCE 3-like [Camelina sativa]|uniref:Protein SHI RELATED SEQUENCE 3-like n=1 Tax=Camelina sativa TaxID=90675 RepID=A0ABM0TNT0_CAMSA|nr:PREDICTED: protein SHI RELATED SEQUENCE 3-like [Camelina sativa]